MQWKRKATRGTVPGMSVDPLEMQQEATDRISVDLPLSAVEFLVRYASYRNAMNLARGLTVKKWTRKSAAEALVLAQIRQVQESMREAFEQHGPFPENDADMLAYARAVLVASEKPSKKSR